MPVCSNCSNPIDAKTKFCPYCDAPVEVTYPAAKDASGAIVGASNQISALMKRYRDAYLVGKVIDGFGGLVKAIGMVVAALLVVAGLLLAVNGREAAFALGVVGIFSGIFVGLLFYLLGVLVSAQGQILKASLDSAVNTSPFLVNEHRAKIMSLPEP
jgi:hypothetical protein